MEKKLLISLRPMMPYFFGGEKNLAYGDINSQQALKNPYFIESEKIPSQSTLFGLTRYLGIEEKRSDYTTDENIIGKKTFLIEDNKQQYGEIKGISGLFIEKTENGKKEYYIRTPFDHYHDEKYDDEGHDKNDVEQYTPFSYSAEVHTTIGKKLLPTQYDTKCGMTNTYMSVTDGTILKEDDIFKSDVQVKICKTKEDDAFLKKKYWTLKNGYSFAYIITVGENYPEIKDHIVYMGKEKSPFQVTVTDCSQNAESKINDPMESAVEFLDDMHVTVDGKESDQYIRYVALSDCCLDYKNGENDEENKNHEAITNVSSMAYIRTKNHREFVTNYDDKIKSHLKRYSKQKSLYTLITAGSVFIVPEKNKGEFEKLINNKHMQVAGYNKMNGGKES